MACHSNRPTGWRDYAEIIPTIIITSWSYIFSSGRVRWRRFWGDNRRFWDGTPLRPLVACHRPLSRRLDRCDRMIQNESRDPFGGNVYYVTMQIMFLTRNFRNGERNLHCDVVHITTKWVSSVTLDCNGVFAIKAYAEFLWQFNFKLACRLRPLYCSSCFSGLDIWRWEPLLFTLWQQNELCKSALCSPGCAASQPRLSSPCAAR